MSNDPKEPKLLIPGLKPFYDIVEPLSWLIVRVAAGLILAVHGWGKISRGPSGPAKALAERGIEPALMWTYVLIGIEFVGGIGIALGLLTRFFAPAAAIQMAVITWIYLPNGFSWLNRGYEFTLLWGAIFLAIALRGSGPYSLDRKIGTTL